MLTTNPWVAYLSLVTPLLTAYYLIVGFVYYRHDWKARLSHRKTPAVRAPDVKIQPVKMETEVFEAPEEFSETPSTPNTNKHQNKAIPEPWEDEGLMQQLEDLSIHLKQAIAEAHMKHYSKEDFILLTQMTCKEYPALYGTPFQLSVNQLIETELSKYGSIHLSSEDRLRMWNQVD